MKRYQQIDNRDSGQMYEYLEARIDAMKRRIAELESENERMRDWLVNGTDKTSTSAEYTHLNQRLALTA